jgi:hypothetical protein
MTRDEFEKKYFEERIQPAIDNGPDEKASLTRERRCFEKKTSENLLKEITVIFFRNDGKSIGAPLELKSFVQMLTPEEDWEAMAFKDGARGLYKGWSWTFFPTMRDRIDGD